MHHYIIHQSDTYFNSTGQVLQIICIKIAAGALRQVLFILVLLVYSSLNGDTLIVIIKEMMLLITVMV